MEKIIQNNKKTHSFHISENHYDVQHDPKSNTILKLENIHKRYGSKKVLKGINLEIKRGERVVIIAANGAGKTTLAEIIAQIRIPNKGVIHYNFAKEGEPATKIGFQFQESVYPGRLKVKNILKFYYLLFQDKIDPTRVEKLLDIFNLKELLNRPIAKMSGGQKQRFNVLLGILHTPELLILDELTTGLDIEAKTYIKEFIRELINANNLTLFLISHNADEMDYLANRFIILEDGKIYQDIKRAEVIKKYKSVSHFVEQYFYKHKKDIVKTHKEMEEINKKGKGVDLPLGIKKKTIKKMLNYLPPKGSNLSKENEESHDANISERSK